MTAPYLLLPIGIALLTLYLLSWLLSHLGVFSASLHRRMWNWLLLLTFTTSALLGVVMVVQINQKIEIPLTELLLKWHVNAGIAMTLIGFIHLIRHLSYYLKPQKIRSQTETASQFTTEDHPVSLPIFAFSLGYLSIVAQTLVIRQFLTLFYGNEFNIALILFVWMLLTGLGAFAGSRNMSGKPLISTSTMLAWLSGLPVFLLFIPGLLSRLILPAGTEAGPWLLILVLLISLLPFCLMNGYAFSFIIARHPANPANPARTYGWESVGGVAGGIIITFMILTGYSNLKLYSLLVSPLVALVIISLIRRGKNFIHAIRPFLLFLPSFIVFVPSLEKKIEAIPYPNQQIIGHTHGLTGQSVITKSGEQTNLYQNGILVESFGDVLRNEEFIHLALLQRENVGNILVVGGVLSGIVDEINQHHPLGVDYVEPDPRVEALGKKNNLLPGGPNVSVINKSVNRHLKQTDQRYRFVLINLPGPHSLSFNRYYTTSFLRDLRESLEHDGIVVWTLPSVANYVSEEAAKTIGSVYSTAKANFGQAVLFPGEQTYLMMSDSTINTNILELLDSKAIKTKYLNQYYFDPGLYTSRIQSIEASIPDGEPVNTLIKPVAFRYYMTWWLSKFNMGSFGWITLVLLLAGGMIISTWKAGLNGMFTMGFISSGIELICLLALQMYTGILYQLTGLMIAVFMAGLAAGSLLGTKKLSITSAGRKLSPLLLISLLAFLSAWIIEVANRSSSLSGVLPYILFMINFGSAFLVGNYFSRISARRSDYALKGGRNYGTDLWGAALGAILIPIILIPVAGIVTSLMLLSGLGLVSLFIEILHKKA